MQWLEPAGSGIEQMLQVRIAGSSGGEAANCISPVERTCIIVRYPPGSGDLAPRAGEGGVNADSDPGQLDDGSIRAGPVWNPREDAPARCEALALPSESPSASGRMAPHCRQKRSLDGPGAPHCVQYVWSVIPIPGPCATRPHR